MVKWSLKFMALLKETVRGQGVQFNSLWTLKHPFCSVNTEFVTNTFYLNSFLLSKQSYCQSEPQSNCEDSISKIYKNIFTGPSKTFPNI